MGINVDFLMPPTLKHINLRKENGEEYSALCVDLKIEGVARIGEHGELIQRLLGCTPYEAFRFWLTNEDVDGGPDPAFVGIEKVKSWASFESGHELQLAGLMLRPSKLSKFEFKPKAGYLVELTFSASIREITDDHLAHLSDRLMEDVRCKVIADPDLIDDMEATPA